METALTAVRSLIDAALSEGDYAAVGEIAPIADSLAAILRHQGTESSVGRPADGHAMVSSQRPRKSAFPRFERDGDRLVKVGWSAKEKKTYEHRVPRRAVIEVSTSIDKAASRGIVRPDRVAEKLATQEQPIPSYQTYVTIAWLRTAKVLKKVGREGYSAGLGVGRHIEKLWDELPQHVAVEE